MKSVWEQWEKEGKLDDILLLVKRWRGQGAEMSEIADKLHIAQSTLYKYQAEHSEFAEALKVGKEIMDATVENSLFKECVGYEYEETTTITTAIIDKKTGQPSNLERVERRTTKKYARPSATSIAYYLNNRVPEHWKNKVYYDKVYYDGEADDGILPKLLGAMLDAKNERDSDA